MFQRTATAVQACGRFVTLEAKAIDSFRQHHKVGPNNIFDHHALTKKNRIHMYNNIVYSAS
jgi:hypothetical protein